MVVRLFMLSPAASSGVLSTVLAVIAVASILIGNLLALTQSNLKRLLGYSSIAHFGYRSSLWSPARAWPWRPWVFTW